MRPVGVEDVDNLVKHRPILLMSITYLCISYINFVVYQSTFRIPGGCDRKGLPLELWDMIIDILLADATKHENFTLVRPFWCPRTPLRHILPSRTSALLCEEYVQRIACGALTTSIPLYEGFLNNPQIRHMIVHRIPLPVPTGRFFTVDIDILAGENPRFRRCLHRNITVPDIIARLESGHCRLCKGSRRLDPGKGRWSRVFYSIHVGQGNAAPCPVCVSAGYAGEMVALIKQQEMQLERGHGRTAPGWVDMAGRQTLLWVSVEERLQDLGYRSVEKRA